MQPGPVELVETGPEALRAASAMLVERPEEWGAMLAESVAVSAGMPPVEALEAARPMLGRVQAWGPAPPVRASAVGVARLVVLAAAWAETLARLSATPGVASAV